MTQELAVQTNALAAYSVEQKNILKTLIAPNHNDMELQLFLEFCRGKGLDPFSKEVYSVKRKGKVAFQMGIDGLRRRAGDQLGGQHTFWCGSDGEWRDVWLEKTPPAAAKVLMFRKGCQEPFTAIALWNEYKPAESQSSDGGDNGFMWRKMPANQLAKCAEALALRKAFPSECGSIYSKEEMEQDGPGDGKGRWGDSGSKEAAQAVATRKLEELAKDAGAGFVTVSVAGNANAGHPSVDPREIEASATYPELENLGGTVAPGDIAEDSIPEATRKGKARPGTTTNYLFLSTIGKLKDAMKEATGSDDTYYTFMLTRTGKDHANKITDPQEQKNFYRALQSETLYWEVRKAGGALFDEEGFDLALGNQCYMAVKKLGKSLSHADELWREAKRDGRLNPQTFTAWLLDAAKAKGKS